MASHGLPRISGGIAARERAAWEGQCALRSCVTGAPVVGVVESVSGPVGFCEPHCDGAERHGATVRRERLTRTTGSSAIGGTAPSSPGGES